MTPAHQLVGKTWHPYTSDNFIDLNFVSFYYSLYFSLTLLHSSLTPVFRFSNQSLQLEMRLPFLSPIVSRQSSNYSPFVLKPSIVWVLSVASRQLVSQKFSKGIFTICTTCPTGTGGRVQFSLHLWVEQPKNWLAPSLTLKLKYTIALFFRRFKVFIAETNLQ